MRRRLSESSELVNFSNAQRRQESLDRAIERTALANRNRTGVSFAPEVKTSNRFDDESNNFDDSREQWQQDLPAALSSSANDLGDVMSALGVRSQPSISTGNNNSILTSSSVSSGDAEMTSVEKRLKALVNTALQSPLRR